MLGQGYLEEHWNLTSFLLKNALLDLLIAHRQPFFIGPQNISEIPVNLSGFAFSISRNVN